MWRREFKTAGADRAKKFQSLPGFKTCEYILFSYIMKHTEISMKERGFRMLKRLIAFMMCLVLLVSAALAEAPAEGKYPTSWDLTQIYAATDDWYADYERAMALVPEEGLHRGTLHTPQGIYDAFDLGEEKELYRIYYRLYYYCSMGAERMPSDPVFADMCARMAALSSAISQETAYRDAEIYSLSLEQRQALFSDPLLADYAYYFKDYLDPQKQPLSEETAVALSQIGPSMGYGEWISSILNSSDIAFPMITLLDGSEAPLTYAQYTDIINDADYSREFKLEAMQMYMDRLRPFENTFAALLEMNHLEYWGYAQINQYESGLEYALGMDDIEIEIYDMLIDAVHEGLADYQRYLNLHKQALGLEEQYGFDLNQSLSEYSISDIPYDTAVDTVREALRVLGDDYIADYDLLMNSPVNDVYPAEGKSSGAFSTSSSKEFLPFTLFNYVGYPDDVSTIAHELGHSIYSLRALRNQCPEYAEPTTFTHEVASTTNELLYYNYMMQQAADEDERLFYLEKLILTFTSTFFTQTMFAEFEDWMHKQVEAGGGLNGAEVSEKYREIVQLYRGDTCEQPEFSDCYWIDVPHFFYNYYVYQYATSVTYAAAICQRIVSGEEGVVQAYLNFLDLGASASPAELLQAAGVDPLQEASYQLALDFFSGLVDEYERLVSE